MVAVVETMNEEPPSCAEEDEEAGETCAGFCVAAGGKTEDENRDV